MEYRVLDSIEPIAPEWDDLATRAGAPPFLRPGWFQAWWDSFGRGRLEILTAAARRTPGRGRPDYQPPGHAARGRERPQPAHSVLAEDAVGRARSSSASSRRSRSHTSLCYVEAEGEGTRELERARASPGAGSHRGHAALAVRRDRRCGWEQLEAELSRRSSSRPARRRRRSRRRRGQRSRSPTARSVRRAPRRGIPGRAVRLEGRARHRDRLEADRPGASTRGRQWAAARGSPPARVPAARRPPIAFQYRARGRPRRGTSSKAVSTPAHTPVRAGQAPRSRDHRRAVATGAARFEFLGADEPWKLEWGRRAPRAVLVSSRIAGLRARHRRPRRAIAPACTAPARQAYARAGR